MGEVKHTPGPWQLLEVGDHPALCPATEDNASILTIVEEDGVKFAAVYNKADAHLIAAAPDMLTALKLFNLQEEWIVGGSVHSLTLRVPITVIQAAAAAVAKAEGRS